MQSVAAQRPFFFDHIQELTEQAFNEFYELTGRKYERVMTYKAEDADYLILGQGSIIPSAEVVVDYIRETRGIKVGVVDLVMFRPFPGDMISKILKGKKGVVVLERLDQPLAADLPIIREIRATLTKCVENGLAKKSVPYPHLETYKSNEVPALYSGSFGMGSRDLQPEGIIGAIENMLPDGANKKLFYLSIDFIRETAFTPKQQIYQETIQDAYPNVKELSVRGTENPNLMPDGAITVRFHSVGGWGAITTGKNLAMTLFELLGYHLKANPKYGSEKKGQPTTYYLSAAPEPIRINCEYFYVDVVLSPDPNVFKHTNALAGLKDGGVFIIQSDMDSPEKVWATIPRMYQNVIIEKDIKIFYIDGFKIAREEATDVELQLRMQGIAFQGAFFAASPVMKQTGLTDETLLKAIEDQLQHKFGAKGQRVVDDNMRVVKRGFDEIIEIKEKKLTDNKALDAVSTEPALPMMLKNAPQSKAPMTDIHRFWEQTGNFYMRGMGNDNLTDPFIGLSAMPAVTSLFRDMTGIRFEHPEFIPENCTACGSCYTICPDTAIPGLVSEISDVMDTVIKRVKRNHGKVELLPKAVRTLEGKLRTLINNSTNGHTVSDHLEEAINLTIKESSNSAELKKEFDLFKEELGDFKFAITRPYYNVHEKKQPNSGGLFSITVNPYTCKGCNECVEVCDDDALRTVKQTEDSTKQLRKSWEFWNDLPTTPAKFNRIDDLEEKIGALDTMLLNKEAYGSFASGDGACLGCSEKTVVHLFIATIESLMQPRIQKHVAHLDELIAKLEKHIQLKLMKTIDISDSDTMEKIVSEMKNSDLTMAGITSRLEKAQGSEPVDQDWLRMVTQLLAKLKNLKWKYLEGTTGRGRSKMGMLNSTGCTSVWGSTYPFNPYPFPWANHLFQDSPSLAMGIFEGHMAKMADGFKTIRMAEMELDGKYSEEESKEFFTYFNWHQFTDDEWLLCPPVVAMGGDGAMYDIGFQNLSRAMASGKPIKVIIVDTQVYSNTGGQACTSGFIGQISDMAQYGKAIKGKEEPRKEIGLIAMAHRTTYVLQATMANTSQMIEGFIDGLMTKRPALFNLYTSCQPEHGIGDDMGAHQARLAMESRAYPIFKYNPDNGTTAAECFDLEGNPAMEDLWPKYTLKYMENNQEKSMELAMTFADFAVTEARFRKHFRKAPRDTWNENMVLLSEFLEMTDDEREGLFPFIWTVDKKQNLGRILVAKPIVESCIERRDFWIMLRDIAGVEVKKGEEIDIESKVRSEIIGKISQGLMQLAGGDGSALMDLATAVPNANEASSAAAASTTNGDYMAPWLDTEDCTGCDECININPKIFKYNADKKAFIQDPNAGPYQDLVKAAEKCTAQVIHPGKPADRSAKDADKWIKRGEKFN